MIRLKQCCCGCSLRTGILILLWLGFIGEMYSILDGLSVVLSTSSKQSFLTTSLMPWYVVNVVAIIHALVGVNNRRPSNLLPYIVSCVIGVMLVALLLLLVLIGPSAIGDPIVQHFARGMPNMPKSTVPGDATVLIVVLSMAITIPAGSFFTMVVFSYYKQLQQEEATHDARQLAVSVSLPYRQNSVTNCT